MREPRYPLSRVVQSCFLSPGGGADAGGRARERGDAGAARCRGRVYVFLGADRAGVR